MKLNKNNWIFHKHCTEQLYWNLVTKGPLKPVKHPGWYGRNSKRHNCVKNNQKPKSEGFQRNWDRFGCEFLTFVRLNIFWDICVRRFTCINKASDGTWTKSIETFISNFSFVFVRSKEQCLNPDKHRSRSINDKHISAGDIERWLI